MATDRVKTAIERLRCYLKTEGRRSTEQQSFLLAYLGALLKDCELAEQHGLMSLIADIEQELLELEEYLAKSLLMTRLEQFPRELN